MPELSALLANERWVPVEFNNITFQVAYRPGSTSLKRQVQLQKRLRALQGQENADEEEQVLAAASILCELVSNWDLTENGQPLPVTADVIANKLPGAAFSAIMNAVTSDGNMSEGEKKVQKPTSDAGYQAEDKAELALNGTGSYVPRGTWA